MAVEIYERRVSVGRLVLLGVALVGLLCLVASSLLYLKHRDFLANAVRVEAVIIESDLSKDGVMVRYSAEKSGEVYETWVPHNDKLGASFDQVGRTVTLLYDPDSPDHAARPDFLWSYKPNWLEPAIMLAVASLLAMLISAFSFLVFVLPEMLAARHGQARS